MNILAAIFVILLLIIIVLKFLQSGKSIPKFIASLSTLTVIAVITIAAFTISYFLILKTFPEQAAEIPIGGIRTEGLSIAFILSFLIAAATMHLLIHRLEKLG